jgi:hypothetical protein
LITSLDQEKCAFDVHAELIVEDIPAALTGVRSDLPGQISAKAGQFVSAGTLTGMLRPKPGEPYVATLGPFGTAEASHA